VLAAGGLWFVRLTWRSEDSVRQESSANVDVKNASAGTQPGQILNGPGRLAPPDQTLRFREFTPEQRVEFARKGSGPGG
jgi:hypothetical protein